MKNSGNAVKVAGALLVGAAVGATLGVLFAPDKGSKTRQKIADNAKKMSKNAKKKFQDQVDNLKSKASKEIDELRKQADRAEKKVEEKVADLKSNVEHKIGNVADAAKA